MNQEIVIKLRAEVDKANANMVKARKHLLELRGAAQNAFVRGGYKKAVEEAEIATKRFNKAIGNVSKPFAGYAMSIMFFGMAIQRAMDAIWKSGTKTFNDVMHSVEGTTTGFDMLEGSLKYLQFSVGEALEPLAEALIPIIDFITDLVQQNPELVRGIVAWGAVLGAIFTVGGGGVLALNGFLELKDRILSSGAAIDSLPAKMMNVANAIGYMVGTAIVIKAVIELATGKKELTDNIDDLLIGAGLMVGIINPAGLAAITIGVALKLLPDDFKNSMMLFLGGVFGLIATAASLIIDTIMYPFALFLNSAFAAYEFFSGQKTPRIETYALTKASSARMFDMFGAAFGDESSQSNLLGNNDRYSIQLFIDSEPVANAVTGRVINNI